MGRTTQKTSVAAYRRHFLTLAKRHRVSVSWCGTSRDAEFLPSERSIKTPRIRSAVTYSIALHELGHALGPQYGNKINQEAQAWEWARRHALEWRDPMKRAAAYWISTHLEAWFDNRRLWLPPPEHPVWKIAYMAEEHSLVAA
jgi:hypothetical protein